MKIQPLAEQEAAMNGGYNLLVVITPDDWTTTTVSTAQTLNLFPVVIGDEITSVKMYLKTPFAASADTAFNTLGLTAGVTGTLNAFVTSTETNANGSYVRQLTFPASPVAPYVSSPGNFTVTVTPTSGKAVSALDVGELHLFYKLLRLKHVSDAQNTLILGNT